MAMAGVSATVVLAALDSTIISTTLPRVAEALDGMALYAWVGTGYLLATAASILIFGRLGDMFGRKPLMLVSVLIAVPLAIHALIRRRAFAGLRDGEQTYARRSSIRTEFISAGLAAVATAVFLVLGITGYSTAMSNLEANIHKEYSPTELDIKYWNGSWATADITLPDGTSYEDAQISMQAEYRPLVEPKMTKD